MMFVLDDVGFGSLSFGGLASQTPDSARFADNGLRYTNMHTTALCSPSRGAILTGRNHHSLGLATISETSTGYPGLQRHLAVRQGHAERDAAAARLHHVHGRQSGISPRRSTRRAPGNDRWPLARGFERILHHHGFFGGDTNQRYPELVYDNHSIEQPAAAGRRLPPER